MILSRGAHGSLRVRATRLVTVRDERVKLKRRSDRALMRRICFLFYKMKGAAEARAV